MQREFQRHTACRDFSATDNVSPGICHEVAREYIIDPGDFIQATDSHTCMGGVNNALAWGVGATEYANPAYHASKAAVIASIAGNAMSSINCGSSAWMGNNNNATLASSVAWSPWPMPSKTARCRASSLSA